MLCLGKTGSAGHCHWAMAGQGLVVVVLVVVVVVGYAHPDPACYHEAWSGRKSWQRRARCYGQVGNFWQEILAMSSAMLKTIRKTPGRKSWQSRARCSRQAGSSGGEGNCCNNSSSVRRGCGKHNALTLWKDAWHRRSTWWWAPDVKQHLSLEPGKQRPVLLKIVRSAGDFEIIRTERSCNASTALADEARECEAFSKENGASRIAKCNF